PWSAPGCRTDPLVARATTDYPPWISALLDALAPLGELTQLDRGAGVADATGGEVVEQAVGVVAAEDGVEGVPSHARTKHRQRAGSTGGPVNTRCPEGSPHVARQRAPPRGRPHRLP